MKVAGKRGGSTRDRLLESACIIFSKKGFRDATVAEICARAEANIAAINYHFGDKEALYVEAWRLAFHRSLEAHPPDGGVRPDAPVSERLRGRILSIMQRIDDPGSHEFEIVQKELANPTGLLAEVVHESIAPIRRALGAIVRELLGERASQQQVQLCQMSIKAQCFDLMMRQRHHKMFPAGADRPDPPSLGLPLESVADHIVRFSLAGIREVRRQIESAELSAPELPRENVS